MQQLILGNDSTAYDLDRFQRKPPKGRKKTPELRIANPGKKARARARTMFTLKAAAVVAVLVASVVAMLYSQAVLTELNQKVSSQQAVLEEAKSENTRLTAELEAKISPRNVEDYAKQKLGMVPVDKSQVIYVDLGGGDKIELTDAAPKKTVFDDIHMAIIRFKEYIASDENTYIEQQDEQEG